MEELLPIGNVVMLENGNKRTVIMGVLQFNLNNQGRIYDYLGVPYPEGYMGQGSSILFNHDSVREVLFRGYENEERQNMLEVMGRLRREAEEAMKK